MIIILSIFTDIQLKLYQEYVSFKGTIKKIDQIYLNMKFLFFDSFIMLQHHEWFSLR